MAVDWVGESRNADGPWSNGVTRLDGGGVRMKARDTDNVPTCTFRLRMRDCPRKSYRSHRTYPTYRRRALLLVPLSSSSQHDHLLRSSTAAHDSKPKKQASLTTTGHPSFCHHSTHCNSLILSSYAEKLF